MILIMMEFLMFCGFDIPKEYTALSNLSFHVGYAFIIFRHSIMQRKADYN